MNVEFALQSKRMTCGQKQDQKNARSIQREPTCTAAIPVGAYCNTCLGLGGRWLKQNVLTNKLTVTATFRYLSLASLMNAFSTCDLPVPARPMIVDIEKTI